MGHDSSDNEVFVGLDYHQDSVQVCVLDRRGRELVNRSCVNDWRAVVSAVPPGVRMRRAALEACTGSADLASELTGLAGWSVDQAHPGYVSRLKGSPDKTDFSDARLLADLTRVGYLPKVWLAPSWVRELRRLVRYRQQQVDARRNVKLRMSALLREHRLRGPAGARAHSVAWRRWLEGVVMKQLPDASAWVMGRHLQRLEQLAQAIRVAEDRLWDVTGEDQLTMRLLEQPQVGPVTAWVLRAEVGRFDRFNNGKSLARFCGLSPRNASSGARQADAGLVKAGSNLLRATLIELAHRLTRREPRWRSFKQHLREQGKAGSVAAAAVANRWVRKLYHTMRQTTDTEATGHDAVIPCGRRCARPELGLNARI